MVCVERWWYDNKSESYRMKQNAITARMQIQRVQKQKRDCTTSDDINALTELDHKNWDGYKVEDGLWRTPLISARPMQTANR